MKDILGHEPWKQVNVAAVWSSVCESIGHMRGTDGHMASIRPREPHEYPPGWQPKYKEDTKCK